MRYETRLKYRRGFLIASLRHKLPNPEPVAGWNRVLTDHFKVFVHPDVDVLRVEDTEGRIAIALGDIFVSHGHSSLEDVLLQVMGGDRAALDALGGRFALAVFSEGDCRIVQDPLGSQSVFYSLAELPIATSHAALLASCEEVEPSEGTLSYMSTEEYSRRGARFLPGDLTVFEGIVHLIPNNELDLKSGQTMRFWPRAPIEQSTFSGLKTEWFEYFANYAAYLGPRYAPVLGLTGGKDSRAVIAALRVSGMRLRYVTWDKMDAAEVSRIGPMVDHLGGRHRWVAMKEAPDLENLDVIREAAREATGYTRGVPLLPAQMSLGAGARDVFLRGLGGEVLRGPFHRNNKRHLPDDLVERVYALYSGPIRKTAGSAFSKFTRRAIEVYCERANMYADLHNVDVGDLVYWEQRMGTWSSVQHAELSVTMNSHSAINSRHLFATAWGLSDEVRFDGDFMVQLMAAGDPILAGL